MKIRAIVQSPQWLDRAGVRIRYRRIAPRLESLGGSIDVDVIDNLPSQGLIEDDVVILSKCTDARAFLVADYLRERGIIVGIDMFDDYFSPGISPCHGHREFLSEIATRVDFFLCSTERMRDVAREFAPNTPSHVLNDPFDTLDKEHLSRRLAEKARLARESGRIDVVWFGNGDNPIFPVGLTDVAAFAPVLQPLVASGFDVRMRVLTNLRAMKSENLARLRGLPIPLLLEEWSEAGEEEARDSSLISFIPVNHQNFSIAKSLNRGISALTGGTQILSAGFDLYSGIGEFVYRDADSILADLATDTLRLRPDTVSALETCMDGLADPANEARRLLTFLRGLQDGSKAGARLLHANRKTPRAMIHGRRSSGSTASFCRDRDVVSIGTPFRMFGRRYDMTFDFGARGGGIRIWVGYSASKVIAPDFQARLMTADSADSPYPFVLDLPEGPASRSLKNLRAHMVASRAGQMVHYVSVMAAIEIIARQVLPGTQILHSEQETPLLGLSRLERPALSAGGAR